MKKPLFVLLVITLGMVTAQQAEEPTGNEQAMVRVAHLAPDVSEVEIAVDGEPTFEALAFRDVSDYQPVPAGTVDITIMTEGEEMASEPLEFEAGSRYTLVVLYRMIEVVEEGTDEAGEEAEEAEVPGEQTEAAEEEADVAEESEAELRLVILADEVTTPPGDNEALVRVLHAFDDDLGEGIDFAPISTTPEEERQVVLSISYGQVSHYLPVPADVEGFEVVLIEGRTPIAEIGAGEIEQGRIYTLILTEDEAGLADLIIQEDDLTGEEEGAESTAEESEEGAESTAGESEGSETEVEAAGSSLSWTGDEEFTTETFEASGELEISLGAWCYDGVSHVRVTAFNQDGEEVGEVTVIGQGTKSGVLNIEPGMYYLEVTSPDMDVYSWELVVQPLGAG